MAHVIQRSTRWDPFPTGFRSAEEIKEKFGPKLCWRWKVVFEQQPIGQRKPTTDEPPRAEESMPPVQEG